MVSHLPHICDLLPHTSDKYAKFGCTSLVRASTYEPRTESQLPATVRGSYGAPHEPRNPDSAVRGLVRRTSLVYVVWLVYVPYTRLARPPVCDNDTVWSKYGSLVAPTWSGALFSRSCNNHFWLQVGSLEGAGSACDENEIGTWIPLLTLNTHRGLQYGPFARL